MVMVAASEKRCAWILRKCARKYERERASNSPVMVHGHASSHNWTFSGQTRLITQDREGHVLHAIDQSAVTIKGKQFKCTVMMSTPIIGGNLNCQGEEERLLLGQEEEVSLSLVTK